LHLETVFIYDCESRISGAKGSRQKIKNNYGNYNDYLHTGVHDRLILKYLLGIAIYYASASLYCMLMNLALLSLITLSLIALLLCYVSVYIR
jgi:hypothetical protein